MTEHSFLKYNTDFELFGTQHLVVIALMIGLSILLSILGRYYFNEKTKLWVSRFMSVSISFWALIYVVILMGLGKFNYKTDLPFELCNMMAVLLPVLMWKPTFKVHQVLYFLILAGTMQAVLTPYLYNGFPNFIFIKYWWIHAGLVVFAVYHTAAFRFRPTLKSIWYSFLALNGYVLLMAVVNLILGSNYVYIMGKPPTASALDYLGPWPVYILMSELIGVVIFFLTYLPIVLTRKRRKEVNPSAS